MNHITREEPQDYIPFSELQPGDTFFVSENTYMKMSPTYTGDKANACNLNKGHAAWFKDNKLVTTLGAVSVVKPETTETTTS